MEPSDLNTHLPPRKRLLAGLRTAATACDAEPFPSPVASGDLAARLLEMARAANASSSSPEEMIEAARAAAEAAADAALAARAAAAEKAAVATKARAAARAAMEFLDSFSRTGTSRNGLQFKVKSRKKHVQVKLLYKPNGRVESRGAMGDAPKPRRRRESDEEVARSLHRAMNSSPRISHTGPKRPRSTAGDGKDGVVPGEGGGGADPCNGSSTHAPTSVGGLANGCSKGKSNEKTVPLFKHECPDDVGEESSRHTAKSSNIADNGVGIGNLSAGRKVKIKRKELFLNQHRSKKIEEPKETEPSIHSLRHDELKLNGNGTAKRVTPADAKASGDVLGRDESKSNGNGAEKRVSPADAKASGDGLGRDESKSNGNGAEKRVSPADAKASGDGLAPMKITSVWKFKKLKTSHCSSDSKMLHNVCSSPSAAETSASVKAD